MEKLTLSELYAMKAEFEQEIERNKKMLARVRARSNSKLIDHFEEEIGILNVDLEHIIEDIEKLTVSA